MKNILMTILLFSTVCTAYSQDNVGNYTIDGNVRGLENDTAILSISGSREFKTDTAFIKNGKFHFSGVVSEPTNAHLSTRKRRLDLSLFLEPGNIAVNGDLSLSDKINVTGTQDNVDLTELNAKENAGSANIKSLKSAYKKAKDENDTLAVTKLTSQLNEAFEHFGKLRTKARLEFIKTHPTSLASAAALYVVQDDVSWQELEPLYQNLSPRVKKNQFCNRIPDKIAAGRRTDIKMEAPGFTIKDINGKPVNLSSFRGKYVLLDFWASWCVPCRQENKTVLKVYEKYRNTNFTVLGISLDENEARWKEAVIKDGLTWTNVCDLKATNGEVVKLYGVQPIPDNFLVDPQGKIIGRKLYGEKLEQKLEEVLK